MTARQGRRAKQKARRDGPPITFAAHGDVFTCRPRLNAPSRKALAGVLGRLHDPTTGAEERAELCATGLDLVLNEESASRFAQLMRRRMTSQPSYTVDELHAHLIAAVHQLGEAASGRPNSEG